LVFFFLYIFLKFKLPPKKTIPNKNQIFSVGALRAATLILHWEGSIQAKIQKISILIMKSIFVFPATLVLETQKNDFYS
ncbi:MAG: hypothetical protein ACK6C8_02945, partial [Pseudanabaena sp.]